MRPKVPLRLDVSLMLTAFLYNEKVKFSLVCYSRRLLKTFHAKVWEISSKKMYNTRMESRVAGVSGLDT